jgi:UDP-2,4-diacetamido-2,4,6-trideoxy-beta-L-altropyranose hydrolase
MRCLTLAEALRIKGGRCHFLCRSLPGNLIGVIREHGFEVSELLVDSNGFKLPSSGAPTEPAHAQWLECDWRLDAEQSLEAIQAIAPDWLIVDHYAIDAKWEEMVKPHCGKLMVIDDLADRLHACDLLLDQNLGRQPSDYSMLVPAYCTVLIGPPYALLQPVYGELHDLTPPRSGAIRRIFIFMSGADKDNLTGLALAAFIELNRSDIAVDVVVSKESPFSGKIFESAHGHRNIHFYSNLPTLAYHMAKADVAIGAGGSATWERLCLGLPSLVVTLSDNQRPAAEALNRLGLIRLLGHYSEIDKAVIKKALDELLQSDLDCAWSERCKGAIDGKGVPRVRLALTAGSNSQLTIRPAKLHDEAQILAWANNKIVRLNAFSSESISADTHRIWFRGRLERVDSYRIYMIEIDDIPIGQVRFERQGEVWEVDYSLDTILHGRGMGPHLLDKAILRLRDEVGGGVILGRVKATNRASRRVFEALGFERLADDHGALRYRRTA